MQQNWFTTSLIAVLAGALGAVGFGVAGAQSDDGGNEPVTINLEPAAAADGSADSISLVCPDGVGATGQGGGGAQGGGGTAPANTNTVVNGIEIQNENEQEQEQEQLQVDEDIVVTEPEVDAAPADTSEQAVTPDTTTAP